jgi:hypothetical protein
MTNYYESINRSLHYLINLKREINYPFLKHFKGHWEMKLSPVNRLDTNHHLHLLFKRLTPLKSFCN